MCNGAMPDSTEVQRVPIARLKSGCAALLGGLLLCAAACPAQADDTDAVRKVLGESFAAMQAAKSFRSISATEEGGTKVTVQNDTIWPDRFHTRNGAQEFIFIPGASYMKQGGTWNQLPVDMSEMVRSLSPDAMQQSLANLSNAKLIGEETIKGRTAIVVEYDTHARVMGIDTKSHVKAWIDAKTKLPIQQHSDGTALGRRSKAFTIYDFKTDLRIVAPL